MFEEQIAQGRDMLRRLEAEWRLPSDDRDNLPAHLRVPIAEAVAWEQAVADRIQSSFGHDTIARYQGILDLRKEDIDRDVSDGYAPHVTAWHRILALLEELDGRPRAPRDEVKHPTPAADARRAQARTTTLDVFISHAWEDKDSIARPLYAALIERGVTVWFDEATLELGDSLRRKIDDGLARCRYGVLILSPAFLSKEWPQRELDALIARETASGEKAVLPIWHELDYATLVQRSPMLADRIAARSEEGVPAIVERILRVVRKTD